MGKKCNGEVKKEFDILRDETFVFITPGEVLEIPAAEIVTWLNSYGDAIIENSYQNVKAEIETFSLPLSEVNTQDGHRNYLKSSGFKSMEVLNQGLNVLNTALARRKKAILSRQLQQENFKIIKAGAEIGWIETALAMFIKSVQSDALWTPAFTIPGGTLNALMEMPFRKKKLKFSSVKGGRQAKEMTSLGNEIWQKAKKLKIEHLGFFFKTSGTSYFGNLNAWVRTRFRAAEGSMAGAVLYSAIEALYASMDATSEDRQLLFWGSQARELEDLLKREESSTATR